jgi:single-strand DNA-binding protein
MFQQIIIVGNLGGDAETRYMPSGDAVANFSVATSEKWKDKQSGEMKERTEWHKCALFGKIAESLSPYLLRGKQVMCQGKVRTRKWQDQSGNDRYSTEVIVDQIKLLGGKGEGSSGAGRGQIPPQSGNAEAPAQPGPDDFDDDIPF